MLSYQFMRFAFLIGIMLAIIIPLIGQTCVLKRLSTIGDALAHTALLGVSIGLIANFSPLFISIITCIIASLIIEFIRKRFSKYSELSVAIVMTSSIALAAIFSSFSSSSSFSSYLFGSILLISKTDIIVTFIVFVVIIIFYFGFYHQIMYISYNEVQARLDGVNVTLINVLQTAITAIVIALSSKVIGALMVSSLMIIPYASAIQISKNYKKSMVLSIIFSLIAVISGLIFAYYFNLQPGGSIVVCSTIILIICMITNKIFKFVK